jgi:hypothetical protein
MAAPEEQMARLVAKYPPQCERPFYLDHDVPECSISFLEEDLTSDEREQLVVLSAKLYGKPRKLINK